MKDERDLLLARYLEDPSDPGVQEELAGYLEQHPEEIAGLLELLRDHAALTILQSKDPDRLASLVMSALEYRKTGQQFSEGIQRAVRDRRPRPKTTRRTARRESPGMRSPGTMLAIAAAGILFAVALLWGAFSETPGSLPSAPARVTRERTSQAPESQRSPEESDRSRELARQSAEARRRAAEAELLEIEKKRQELLAPPPNPEKKPESPEERKKALDEIQKDKERIEQELRQAAELAKKAPEAVPAPGPREPRPPSPDPAPRTPLPDGTNAAVAAVEEVVGEAYSVVGDRKTPLAKGGNVLASEGLETGGGTSRIVLRFPDKTHVDLGPDTRISDLRVDGGKRFTLSQGSVRAVVAKQPKGEPMILRTPSGQAKVLGTTLRLTVNPDPKKETRLDVEEGKVEFGNLAGKTILVETGHYAVAGSGVELVARVLPPRKRPAAFVVRDSRGPWGAMLQTVRLVRGRTYVLSVWIQTTDKFPGGSIGVRSEAGSVVLAQQPFGASSAYLLTSLSFKSDADQNVVVFAGFANSANGQHYFRADDWSLTEKGGDGTNLIQDPDYERQIQTLSGPWSFEGPSNGGMWLGINPSEGRVPGKGNP